MTFTRLHLDGRPLSVYTRGGSWQPTPPGIPPEVRVGSEVWRVLLHSQLYGSRSSKSRLAGCAIHHERAIILDPSVPAHEMRATLGHELAHAYLFAAKETSAHLRKLTNEQEEAICDLFACALIAERP